MRRRRKIRPDAILHTPKLLPMPNAEGSIRSLSLQFLLDFEQHWRIHGSEVLDRLAEQQPAAYFAGAVSLAKVMRIELGKPGEFDRPMTPEEIIDRLEQRIGHLANKILEDHPALGTDTLLELVDDLLGRRSALELARLAQFNAHDLGQ